MSGNTLKSRAQLDDTVPMKCTIESSYSVKDHTEYSLFVQFGPLPETSWRVTKRYSDFAALDIVLKNAGFDLSLPPKKVFGKMESDFVEKRQQGLQNYLNAILATRWISFCLDVKLFLCPSSFLNISYQDTALQNICMFLRSENNWELVEPLPYIGWRLRKCYFLVRDKAKPKDKYILTWCCSRPSQSVDGSELENVMKFLSTLQHPSIEPSIFCACNTTCSVTVRKFHEKGTLRDQICNSKPTLHYLKKYSNPKALRIISVSDIKLFGRNILETLKLLHEKGYPYVHLHAGNVVICNGLPRLLDLENWAVGVPSLHRPLYTYLHRLQTLESIEMYSFGHLLYEMAVGHPLVNPICSDTTSLDGCLPVFKSLLLSILGESALKSAMPTIADIISHPFFRDAPLPPDDGIVIKVPSRLKETLKTAKDACEAQLKEDQKLLRQHRKLAEAEAFHMSAEEKKKRRLQKVKSLNELANVEQPTEQDLLLTSPEITSSMPTPLTSEPAPSRPAPLPPVHKNERTAETPGVASLADGQPGRAGLLSSIVGFNKSHMRKAKTVDKSAPRI